MADTKSNAQTQQGGHSPAPYDPDSNEQVVRLLKQIVEGLGGSVPNGAGTTLPRQAFSTEASNAVAEFQGIRQALSNANAKPPFQVDKSTSRG